MTLNYSFVRFYMASSILGFRCIVALGYIHVETQRRSRMRHSALSVINAYDLENEPEPSSSISKLPLEPVNPY